MSRPLPSCPVFNPRALWVSLTCTHPLQRYTALLLSASAKSAQCFRMWPTVSHDMHHCPAGGLRSRGCSPLSLWACVIYRSRTICVSSSRAAPLNGPLTTPLEPDPVSSQIRVSSFLAGTDTGSSSFLYGTGPDAAAPSSLYSRCLSKWLQTRFTMAQSAVSPSFVSNRSPTFSRSRVSIALTNNSTRLVSSTVRSSADSRANCFSNSWRSSDVFLPFPRL